LTPAVNPESVVVRGGLFIIMRAVRLLAHVPNSMEVSEKEEVSGRVLRKKNRVIRDFIERISDYGSGGGGRGKQPPDTAEDALLQLQALHPSHRETTRLLLMTVREGATDAQLADELLSRSSTSAQSSVPGDDDVLHRYRDQLTHLFKETY
jgi:hypothetical protein